MKNQNRFFLFKNWLTLESLYYTLLILILGVFLLPKLAFLTSITEETIIELTNEERQAHGLNVLTANQLLAKAAYAKANAIMASQQFKHNIDNKKFSTWIKNAGYNYSYAGENLAIDFYTSEGVHKAWMESPTHKQNIINGKFTEIGIAVIENEFKGRNTTLVVQIFGSPMPFVSPIASEPTIQGANEINIGIRYNPINIYTNSSLPKALSPGANLNTSRFGISQINNHYLSSALTGIAIFTWLKGAAVIEKNVLLEINYYIILTLFFLLFIFAINIRRQNARTHKLKLSQ